MLETSTLILATLFLLVAVLYSSVGHAGASGYLAAMALLSVAPEVMKPTSLCLNILVATIATVQYARAGCFSWRLFWPFAVASIPLAFVGGWIVVPGVYYKPLIGLILLYAAWRMLATASRPEGPAPRPPALPVALAAGGGIGLLSGLSGTGGGIFLTPLMLMRHWCDARKAAGVSAAFILVNSISGLAGLASKKIELPAALPIWAAAAVVGGLIGSHLGSRRFGGPALRRALAAVLVIAGIKLLLVW